MPTLGAPLDFAKLEGRNFRGHLLGTAPGSPVTGQLYYNTGDNTLYWYDGTQWVSARGGVASVPDASPTVKGIVQLAGDLDGTAVSPQIRAGVITDAEVATANKDGSNSVPGMRRLNIGQAGVAMDSLATLNAIGLTNPATNDVPLNSRKITGLADPTAAQDAATKAYVDAAAQGLDAKASCRLATTANIALTGSVAVDGVTPGNGQRVLVKNQTSALQNGIYVVNTAGAWTRAPDADQAAELPSAYTWIEEGTVNADTGWVCITNVGFILGTDDNTWVQFSGAGQITAGAGLTKTGNSLDVGAGTGISVAADSISVDSAIMPRYYSSATHSAGTSITIPQATHGCRASRGLIVMTVVEATGAEVLADVVIAANGDVSITFAVSQSANTIRTTVIG